MPLTIETASRQVRTRFDSGFYGDIRAHHLTRRDVERVLQAPRWVDRLGAAEINRSVTETASVWYAGLPAAPRASSILIVTRGRADEQRVHDAWRVYHGDVDLSRVRSARDALAALLGRYGLEMRLGLETKRLFTAGTVPMGATANTQAQVLNVPETAVVRTLEMLRLVPEAARIEVTVAFAINETALRRDLAKYDWQRTPRGNASLR